MPVQESGFQPPPSPSLARFESSLSFDNGGLHRDTCLPAYAVHIVCVYIFADVRVYMRMMVSAPACVCVCAGVCAQNRVCVMFSRELRRTYSVWIEQRRGRGRQGEGGGGDTEAGHFA